MITSRSVTLVDGQAWDPFSLLAEAFKWPGMCPVTPLSTVASLLAPATIVNYGAEVVTPGDIDPVHGFIKRRSATYQGAVYAVGRGFGDLEAGDVLVPRSASTPAVLITDQLEGSLFSDGFVAYRPETAHMAGPLLWAVLCSTSGQALRQVLLAGRAGITSSLDQIEVPIPSPVEQEPLQSALLHIASRIDSTESEAVATWWSMANLQDIPWQFALATPDPERLLVGEPLGDFVEIVMGRRPDDERVVSVPSADSLPIATGATLAGRPPKRWLEHSEVAITASTGDVLVAMLGRRANAQIVSEPMVVGSSVLRVRPHESNFAPQIASFLNSQAGYARRQVYMAGKPMGHLSVAALREMTIPEDALNGPMYPGLGLSLSAELEDLLWKN